MRKGSEGVAAGGKAAPTSMLQFLAVVLFFGDSSFPLDTSRRKTAVDRARGPRSRGPDTTRRGSRPSSSKLTGKVLAPGHAAREAADPGLQGAGRDERSERPRAARAAAAAVAAVATGAGRHDSSVERSSKADDRRIQRG